MKIGFIGFGEAARAFKASLGAGDTAPCFAAYDILLESEGADGACADAMREHGVAIALPAQTLADCDWVFSAVTADQSLEAARAACAWLRPSTVYLDINSVSPDRKRDSAALVARAGAVYLDMAVMAPVHPRGHRTPVLIAGPTDPAMLERLDALGFSYEIVADEAGAATAIKMVRSMFVKGLEAITVEALLAAHATGCLDYVVRSISGSYPGLGFADLAGYHFERSLRHGTRRAAEMRESAATFAALGLNGALGAAIADTQAAMGKAGGSVSPAETLEETIARVANARPALPAART